MADSKINLQIGTKVQLSPLEKLKSAIRGVKDSVAKMMGKISAPFSAMGGAFKGIFSQMTNIKSAIDLVSSATEKFKSLFASALNFETTSKQFERLTGSVEDAKKHMEDLKEMGKTPPFSLEEFSKASRSLMVYTNGTLGYKKSLEMIGDVAAGIGQPIENVADTVGKLFAALQDGEPIGKTVIQLKNMGAITPEVAANIKEMEENGSSSVDIWNTLTESFGKYSGAMADSEKTTQGLLDTIGGEIQTKLMELSQRVLPYVNDGLKSILGFVREFDVNDAIDSWTRKTIDAFEDFKDSSAKLFDPLLTGMQTFLDFVENSGITSFFKKLGQWYDIAEQHISGV